jgi:L-malate glycosyltransferase
LVSSSRFIHLAFTCGWLIRFIDGGIGLWASCLVSDIPANKEWITENENGWLFKDGDSNHLAEKILWAMNQREKLYRMGQAGRTVAEKRADWKKNAEALMNVYRSLGEKNVI